MLNEELIRPTASKMFKLQMENERLKKEIEAFKKYDEERKEYYKFLVEDWQHSDARHIIEGLKVTIKSQKKEIGTLSNKLAAINKLKKYSDEELADILYTYKKVQSVENKKALNNKYKELMKKYTELRNDYIKLKLEKQ